MSSPGSARMSSVASASDGMTLRRYPPLTMFGEIEVRSSEYSSGVSCREVVLDRLDVAAIDDAAVARRLSGGEMPASPSK